MCEDCGCGNTELVSVELHERILAGNDKMAAHLREHFIKSKVLAINLMGSPGAGKTAVLEQTARACSGRYRLGAVSGDLATDRDGARLRAAGIHASTITTGSACHLDAKLVHDALHGVAWRELDIFFIENVGNLVCPALFDLGEHAKVVVAAVTEGDDKPLKYPYMFRAADVCLLNKVDLLPFVPFDVEAWSRALHVVHPRLPALPVSATRGDGLDAWYGWLRARAGARREPARR
jgi:hydrogenase nickel incorporation protein HypB